MKRPRLFVLLTMSISLFSVAPAALQQEASQEQVVLQLDEGTNMSAAASPDGQWIAIDLLEDLWLVPAGGGQARRLTTDAAREVEPRWSPDGRRLVFSSNRNGDDDLWILEVASGQTTPLTSGPADDREPDWSPDGRSIVFSSNRHRIAGEASAIYVIPAEGGEVRALTSAASDDLQPAYSPDGQWIAFASDRSGVYRIWRVPAQGGAASPVGSQDDNVESFGPGCAGLITG